MRCSQVIRIRARTGLCRSPEYVSFHTGQSAAGPAPKRSPVRAARPVAGLAFVTARRISDDARSTAQMPIATTNPATGQVEKTFSALTDAEIDQRLQAAADAFAALRRTSFADRAGWM